jgi:hypothetical protein
LLDVLVEICNEAVTILLVDQMRCATSRRSDVKRAGLTGNSLISDTDCW